MTEFNFGRSRKGTALRRDIEMSDISSKNDVNSLVYNYESKSPLGYSRNTF